MLFDFLGLSFATGSASKTCRCFNWQLKIYAITENISAVCLIAKESISLKEYVSSNSYVLFVNWFFLNHIIFVAKTLRFELIKTFKFYVGAEENYKFLLLLMNDQVTSVDFGHHIPEIVSDEATEINADFWLAMAIKCPNMKKIRQCLEKDDSEYPTSFDYRWRKKQYSPLANSMSSTAHHFSQLQVLEMPNARCSDYRLEMLAENLPKLR